MDLKWWRRAKFAWGETDCILAVCNHVRDTTGIDPAMPWRGTYHDKAGAEGIYSAYGGVLALFTHGMARAGFRQATEPRCGDPVVCSIGGHEIAGVYIGPHCVFLTERGCIELRAPVLGAWHL